MVRLILAHVNNKLSLGVWLERLANDIIHFAHSNNHRFNCGKKARNCKAKTQDANDEAREDKDNPRDHALGEVTREGSESESEAPG